MKKVSFDKDKGKYGAVAIEENEEEEGGDTVDITASPPPLGRLSMSLRSIFSDMRGSGGRGRHSVFDSWLRRDFSLANLTFGSSSDTSTSDPIESYLGPTERSIEAMVRNRTSGVEYKSVHRGFVDTAVWHRRKVALIDRRRGKASSVNGEEEEGYVYDSAAVARLRSERWMFDQILVAGIGFAMAIVGLAVSRTADSILERKLDGALERFETNGFASGMLFHVGISTLLAFGAFIPVAFRPVSAGSGIAEAKAALNGVVIPNCTALLTALCKGMSVIMSVAASIPAGLEGPMIHLGLCIGENANRLVPRKYEVLDTLRTDRSRIDYTAIGTAAGVAAAFRSPIAGILFAMEEGASFWSTALTWRCFLSACSCVIAMYAILSIGSGGKNFHITSMALFNGIDSSEGKHQTIPADSVPDFEMWEYVIFVIVGAGGGLVGAAFCVANRHIAVLRRRLELGKFRKALEVVCIAAVYASLSWLLPSLPFFSTCGHVEDRSMGESYFRQFDCPEGQYNELATLLLNPLGSKGITLLFQEDDIQAFSVKTCCAAGLVQLITLCIAFGMSISAGIFIPLLFIGACLGRALALVVGLDPRTYAIVGAAATLGGVVRVLISLTAIVTHTTSLSFFMTPVMVATLLAQTVGNWASGRPGIYDVILHLRDVPFLEEECPAGARHANIRARNVMKTGVITLGTQIRVSDLLETLKTHDFSEFPVVDRDAHGHGEGALVGSITRVDLLAILSRTDIFFSEEEEERAESGYSIEEKALSFAELDRERPKLPLPLPKDIGKDLTAEDVKKYVHLSPYIQIAPHTFGGHGSAERAYEMFRCLGLRSLYVVDKRFCPIGVITRHELALLEEIGMTEHNIEEKVREFTIYTNVNKSFTNQFE